MYISVICIFQIQKGNFSDFLEKMFTVVKSQNITFTEKGAISHASSGSAVLNLFFKMLRTTSSEQVSCMMGEAWEENPRLTLRAVFHLRDCRGGKGERKAFHECLRWLITNGHAKHILCNLENIPFYGTYKDLLTVCAGTELELPMLRLYATTLRNDIDLLNAAKTANNINAQGHANVQTTLAGKWAPTEGGELDKKHQYARKLTGLLKKSRAPKTATIKNLRDYRTLVLGPLRQHTGIVERLMCADDWDEIDYQHVPSVAMKLYRKAFAKHSQERFTQYLDDVKSGKKKINASAVFPHQLVRYYMNDGNFDDTIELQWKEIIRTAAAKFAESNMSAIPLVDVSGSMDGEPMEVAIALGLLLSEITTEAFRGAMLTFTTDPQLFRVDVNKSLKEKVEAVRKLPWGQSTNVSKAFDLILKTAVIERIAPEMMPKTLYIFSDMQFDSASPNNNKTNFQYLEDAYTRAGYKRPNIVFWNLQGKTMDFPVEQHIQRCALVSGFSQSLLDLFMKGEIISPYAVMLSAINAPRYERVVLSNE